MGYRSDVCITIQEEGFLKLKELLEEVDYFEPDQCKKNRFDEYLLVWKNVKWYCEEPEPEVEAIMEFLSSLDEIPETERKGFCYAFSRHGEDGNDEESKSNNMFNNGLHGSPYFTVTLHIPDGFSDVDFSQIAGNTFDAGYFQEHEEDFIRLTRIPEVSAMFKSFGIPLARALVSPVTETIFDDCDEAKDDMLYTKVTKDSLMDVLREFSASFDVKAPSYKDLKPYHDAVKALLPEEEKKKSGRKHSRDDDFGR